ncbi:MAG: YfiR family protein [Verrucomicrobiales bacterium]|nr:YfiR family protein [Verrucomicrobiales bacterium]
MKQYSQTCSRVSTGAGSPVEWAVAVMAGGRRRFRAGLAMTLLLAVFAVGTRAAEDPAREYKVKAAFLLQFTKYVEWPESALNATNAPMVLGLFEEDPAAPIVREQLHGKVVNGRPMIVKLLSDAEAVTNCHMLFLSRARKERVDQLLAQSQGRPVLTVSELDQFALHGGVINFVRKDESFRFEVNLEAAEKARLKISTKLASLATIVKRRR